MSLIGKHEGDGEEKKTLITNGDKPIVYATCRDATVWDSDGTIIVKGIITVSQYYDYYPVIHFAISWREKDTYIL